MTKKEALKRVKGYLTDYIPADNYEEVKEIVEALEQEPCNDAISRQAVLDMDFKRIILTTAKPTEIIMQKVKALPPVTPQPKTGHWIFTKTIFDHHGCTAECSSCHKKWKTYDEITFEKEYNYCFKCGAKMIKPQESESVE